MEIDNLFKACKLFLKWTLHMINFSIYSGLSNHPNII